MLAQFAQYNTGDFFFCDRNSPVGMFTYRLYSARLFLDPYNKKNCGIDSEIESLNAEVALNRPKSALALFLIIIAFEDYIRDFLDGLGKIPSINQYYNPNELLLKPKTQVFGFGVKDQINKFDSEMINKKFNTLFGFDVVTNDELKKLDDLITIRHIVAHFGSYVDDFNQKRFSYFSIDANQILNPTLDQTFELFNYFWILVKKIESGTRDHIFSKIKYNHPGEWRSQEITGYLIRHFSFFQKIISDDTGRTREVVLKECFDLIEKI